MCVQVDWEDSDREGGDDILENLRRNFISTLNQAGDSVRLIAHPQPHVLTVCSFLLFWYDTHNSSDFSPRHCVQVIGVVSTALVVSERPLSQNLDGLLFRVHGNALQYNGVQSREKPLPRAHRQHPKPPAKKTQRAGAAP